MRVGGRGGVRKGASRREGDSEGVTDCFVSLPFVSFVRLILLVAQAEGEGRGRCHQARFMCRFHVSPPWLQLRGADILIHSG